MNDLADSLLKSATGKSWNRIGIRNHHGINFPLSALQSENSCGIGEFFDLIPIIDWCHSLKIDFIQLLPLNNSNSESDPSPYNAISSCALNYLYLSLHALPYVEKFPELKKRLSDFHKFNHSSRINFAEVVAHKTSWLRSYFDEINSHLLNSKELKQFLDDNGWVKPYALFRALKDHLNNTSWKTWPEELRFPTAKQLQALYDQYASAMSFYMFTQFLCFNQLKKIKEYANIKGVFLMGD